MKENFTKGEWVAKTELVGGMKTGLVYIKGGGFDVSAAPDAIANAHLIAAAPDMYRMLNESMKEIAFLVDLYNKEVKDPSRFVDAETSHLINILLAKARGE